MKTPDHLLIRRDDVRKREMLPKRGELCEECGAPVRDHMLGGPAPYHPNPIIAPKGAREALADRLESRAHKFLGEASDVVSDANEGGYEVTPSDVVGGYWKEDADLDALAAAALRDVEPPGGDVREAPESCPNCFDRSDCSNVDICKAVEEVYRPAPPLDRNARREQYARIIEPRIFEMHEGYATQYTTEGVNKALAKADALLALDSNDGAGQREPWGNSDLNELDRAIGIFGRATTETNLDPQDRYNAVKFVRDYLLGLRKRLANPALSVSVRSGVQHTTEQSSSPIGHQK